jgi:uncharacterized protein YndB with AHSA1/START domain
MPEHTQPTFNIDRTFDAPRSLVWRAYTEIDELAKWWGPVGFTWLKGTLELKPGGMFHYGMRAPTGQEMWGKFVYYEVKKPERIVFTNSFSDEKGGTVRAPFNPNWPLEVLNTVVFTEQGGKTLLSMTGSPFNATPAEREAFDSMRPSLDQGFKGTLDQLAEHLAKMQNG